MSGSVSVGLSDLFSLGPLSHTADIPGHIQDENDNGSSFSACLIKDSASLNKSPEAEEDQVSGTTKERRRTYLSASTSIRPDMDSTGETPDNILRSAECDNRDNNGDNNGDKSSDESPSRRASFRLSFGSNSTLVPRKRSFEWLKRASLDENNALLRECFENTTMTIIQKKYPSTWTPT